MADAFLKYRQAVKKNWIAVATFFFFCIYYLILLYSHIDTDIQAHAFVSYKFITEGGALTPNFLYFITIAFFAGFSKYKLMYYAASIFIISLSLTAKYLINTFYTVKYSLVNTGLNKQVVFTAASLMFVFCLPGLNFFEQGDFLLGQLASNTWHNSTVIFLFPFAIVLFFEFFGFIQNFERKKIPLLIFLIVINALIKPSFLFTIMPTVMLWGVIIKNKNYRKILISLSALNLLALALIFVQYFVIYIPVQTVSSLPCKDCTDSVGIEPFAVWKYYSLSIPVSFASSLFFPLLYFIISKGSILKDRLVKFATINWLIGLLIYIVFIETGGRKYHGNFGWQMIIGNYLLFFVLAIKLFNNANEKKSIAYKILLLAFLLHILWGVVYFLKIIFLKNYF